MFKRLKQLFQSKKEKPSDDAGAKLAEAWYEQKSEFMEKILGPAHNMVMPAIIPYAVGGGLDLYYHPENIDGTGIATKELSELPMGPKSSAS